MYYHIRYQSFNFKPIKKRHNCTIKIDSILLQKNIQSVIVQKFGPISRMGFIDAERRRESMNSGWNGIFCLYQRKFEMKINHEWNFTQIDFNYHLMLFLSIGVSLTLPSDVDGLSSLQSRV